MPLLRRVVGPAPGAGAAALRFAPLCGAAGSWYSISVSLPVDSART